MDRRKHGRMERWRGQKLSLSAFLRRGGGQIVKSRSAYKHLIRSKRYQYDKKQTQKDEDNGFKTLRNIGNYLRYYQAVYLFHIFEDQESRLNVFQTDNDILEFNKRYLNQ